MKFLRKPNSKDLSWPVLKALNDLYSKGRTSAKIQQVDFIKYLTSQSDLIQQRKGNNNVLLAGEEYESYYLSHIQPIHDYYFQFLTQAGIATDGGKRFTDDDLRTLMMIFESRYELRKNLMNIEDFSAKIFDGKGSKYLKLRKGVRDAVLQILQIEAFPESKKDLQFRLVVDCTNPRAIILCENKSFLKQPWLAKQFNVKLWYVGGNNISVIDNVDERELTYPIYYSCDWDYDGLKIYQRLKLKFREKGSDIQILTPPEPRQYLPTDSFMHNSKWRFGVEFSDLDIRMYSELEVNLIKYLIEKNKWIEEESNDPYIQFLQVNG